MYLNCLKQLSIFAIFSLIIQIATNFVAIIVIFFIIRKWTPSHGNRLVYFGTEDLSHENYYLNDFELNRLRIERIKPFFVTKHLERLKANHTSPSKTLTQLDRLLISIVASNRTNGEFLQVMGHILAYLPDPMPKILICNTELQRPQDLKRFEPYVEIVDLNANSSLWAFSRLGTIDRRLQKEAEDYWKCLNASSRLRKDYILIMEDDALPVPSIGIHLESLMRQMDVRRHVDYVKLFHPWSLRGIPWIFQSITTALTLSFCLQMLFWRQANYASIAFTAFLVHLVIRVYFYQLFADLRFHLTNSAFITFPESCCTQAVLFRGGPKLGEMIAELSKDIAGPGHAKDHILEESRFVGRQTDANLMVHIGFYSYLRQKTVGMDRNI